MRTSRVSVYDRNDSETILQEFLEELGHKSEGRGNVYWQKKHFNVYSHTTFYIEEMREEGEGVLRLGNDSAKLLKLSL